MQPLINNALQKNVSKNNQQGNKMKKLLSTAVVMTALSTSAMAADVTIGGAFEYSIQDSNGVSTSAVDSAVNIVATQTTAEGLTVSADFNIDQDANDDGGNSLKLSKDNWSLDLGDTNSATDAIDDTTDWGYVLTNGSPSTDHAALLTVSPIDGLSVNVSYAADTNYGTTATAGHAYSASYDLGFAKVGAGKLVNDSGSEELVYNASTSVKGLVLAYELHTATTAAKVDTDTTTMSAQYSIKDITFAVETMEEESASVVSSDEITYGIHYTVAPGLVAFAETTEDEKTASEETTALGLSFKF